MFVFNKRYLFNLFISILMLIPNISSAKNQTLLQTDYQSMLNDLISEHVPGAVLLVQSDREKFIGSAGFKDLVKKQPMTADVVMPNGSAGKKLTALIVAVLAEEGVVALDEPISKYLDQILLSQIQYSDKMTLRQLLNHTSGIFEYNDVGEYDFFKAQYAQQNKVTTDMFPLSFALNQPANFEPGQGHSYSNSGYALVGVILEQVLKEHPSKSIRRKILIPLNMMSSYSKGVEEHNPELASGFFINDADPSFPTPMNVWIDTKNIIGTTATSDAPLAANVEDMATLLRAIVLPNDVISDKVREQMIGERNLVESHGPRFYSSSNFHYGLGIWVEEVNDKKFYHHGGTEFGYYTQNIYIPDGDVSITAFANCGVNDRCEQDFQNFTFEVLNSVLQIQPEIQK